MISLRNNYHKLKFILFYKSHFKSIGKYSYIKEPILITPQSVILGEGVFVRNGARIEGVEKYNNKIFNPKIVVCDQVSIEQNVHITCASCIKIDEQTAIASNVTITDIIHPYEKIDVCIEKQDILTADVYIGKGCKIYNNSVILPGVFLGRHCVVGANSVVTKNNYPDYSIIAGSPAKILKRYNHSTLSWEKTNEKGEFLK